ncbi:MAG: hypothetical protein QS748_03010 [Candidatus Endonucleobacter bathymodioli]|uniref:Ubiquinone biosynthesis accessory factor UbiJ n=1 Tax=Candidatus Endonucleibacter bathymodioli TaxID=539814 RepID=A0AA90SLU6_9GAMM|nr:hypothetical protein [Candidatus Endonucleobacter bathymodioli]
MTSTFFGTKFINDPVIKTTVLAGLEKQLNAVLGLDPVTIVKLGGISGVVIDVQCSDPEFQCYLHLQQKSISLTGHHEGDTDASIRGSIVALTNMVARRDQPIDKVLGLQCQGSPEVLNALSMIHQSFEFDWEMVLCRCFGDIGGHLLAKGFDYSSVRAKRIITTLARNLGEYLQEELRLLPSRNEFDAFVADIADLQLTIDDLLNTVKNLDIDRDTKG